MGDGQARNAPVPVPHLKKVANPEQGVGGGFDIEVHGAAFNVELQDVSLREVVGDRDRLVAQLHLLMCRVCRNDSPVLDRRLDDVLRNDSDRVHQVEDQGDHDHDRQEHEEQKPDPHQTIEACGLRGGNHFQDFFCQLHEVRLSAWLIRGATTADFRIFARFCQTDAFRLIHARVLPIRPNGRTIPPNHAIF